MTHPWVRIAHGRHDGSTGINQVGIHLVVMQAVHDALPGLLHTLG